MNAQATDQLQILLIEDNTGDARIIREELQDVKDLSHSLQHVTHLQQALEYLDHHKVDVVLADLSLPDSPGLETFKRLQAQAAHIPVVVLTGFDNESMALNAVRDGAQDYLIKGQVDGRTLSRTILYAIERHRSQSTLRNLSLTDELTKLYNRRGFMTLGEQALKLAARLHSPLALFYIDLDGLKQINDIHGHLEGDKAISGAAQVLKKTFRQADVVARMGGDEFAALAALEGTGGHEGLLGRLRGNVAQYNLQHPGAYRVGLSTGLAVFDPEHPCSISDLMKTADHNLYGDKKTKKTFLKRNKKWLLLLLVLLLGGLGGLFAWRMQNSSPPPPLPPPVSAPPAPRVPVNPPAAPRPAPAPAIVKAVPAKKPAAAPPASPVPASPLQVHHELVPKNVTIARFTYEQGVHQPNDTFGFTILGSGFTPAFREMLSVYPGSAHVQVRGLRLVTVNHIEGEFVIRPTAPTQYVSPYVLLNDVPVFQSASPFAVIRPSEVLDIVFAHMDADGKGGRFRVYMNLTEAQSSHLTVRSETPGIEVSPLVFKLPYVAEGSLRIAPEVPRGDYGLAVWLDDKEAFRKENLVQVIGPMLGKTGYIQALHVQDEYARPGDVLKITVEGRGFEEKDAHGLVLRVAGCPDSPLLFAGPDRMASDLTVPPGATEGVYDVGVARKDQTVFVAKKLFTVVGANWIRGLRPATEARPGRKTTLLVTGRDIDQAYAGTLRITSEEPGLHLLKPLWRDARTLQAEMEVDASVKPGDYLLQVSSDGHPLTLPERPILIVHQEELQ